MKDATPVQIIRHVHRWSGLLLILFVGMKMLSGLRLAGTVSFPGEAVARWMHFSRWVDVPFFLLFTVHAAYGILRIRMAAVRSKVRAFAVASAAALAVFAFFARYFY
jgi:succinate dehydrogenase/fumarate reductase cytochrome b subunit